MQISGLQKLTLLDFPGKISCTVFLSGCNYRCPWCYNPELVLSKIIEKQSPLCLKDFFQFLQQRKKLLQGVCIGGGEPTLNKDLAGFCEKIKKLGYQVKLDTNGSNPMMLEDLIKQKLVDYVAMDVKGPKEKYSEVIGFKGCVCDYFLEKVQQSINILKKDKVDYEFRTTLIPTLLNKEDILAISHWIRPAKKYVLQNYKQGKTINSRFEKLKPFSEEFLFTLKKAITPFFDIVEIR